MTREEALELAKSLPFSGESVIEACEFLEARGFRLALLRQTLRNVAAAPTPLSLVAVLKAIGLPPKEEMSPRQRAAIEELNANVEEDEAIREEIDATGRDLLANNPKLLRTDPDLTASEVPSGFAYPAMVCAAHEAIFARRAGKSVSPVFVWTEFDERTRRYVASFFDRDNGRELKTIDDIRKVIHG